MTRKRKQHPLQFINDNGKIMLSISHEGVVRFGEGVGPRDIVRLLTEAFANNSNPTPKAFVGYVCVKHGLFWLPGSQIHKCDEKYDPVFVNIPQQGR